jgi:hypothetical protein
MNLFEFIIYLLFFLLKVFKNPEALESEEIFRSPQSDIEIPKTRKRKGEEDEGKGGESTATLTLDPLAMTKENMSTTRRPAGIPEFKNKLCVTFTFRFRFYSAKTIRMATNFDTLQCFTSSFHSWIDFCTTWSCFSSCLHRSNKQK